MSTQTATAQDAVATVTDFLEQRPPRTSTAPPR